MKGILASLLGFVICLAAHAQEPWPSKPVKFIVPSSPGGGTDLYARILAQALGESLKQQFVVENRPGASGNIGAAAAAKSAPDGNTFLVSANPALTVNPSLFRNLPYSAERDFTPVTRGVVGPMVIAVHPSLPVNSVAELVALGKPGVPTLAQAGFPLELMSSFSVVAPSGTPAPIVQRLGAEIGRAMRSPAVAEKLHAQALVPVFDTPEQFAVTLKTERERWAEFIRRNGIEPDQ